MKITPKQYAQALFETTRDCSSDILIERLSSFSMILIENNQASQLDKILSYFKEIWNKESGIVEVEVIIAREMSDASLDKIKKFIEKKAGGRKINMSVFVDESLIGGFIVRMGNEIFDSSLKNRVLVLKSGLND